MTAAPGVDDQEIGDVVRLVLEVPVVGGVCIQPQFGSNRGAPLDPAVASPTAGSRHARVPGPALATWRGLTVAAVSALVALVG